MELTTISMPVETAQERLDAYAKQVTSERTDQDRRIIRGYQSLVKGYPIVELSKSVAAGGFFDHGLPKIAVSLAGQWADIAVLQPATGAHWSKRQQLVGGVFPFSARREDD